MKLLVFMYVVVFQHVNGMMDSNIIDFFLNVFTEQDAKFLQVYTCSSKFDQLLFAKTIIDKSIRFSFSNKVVHSNINPLHYLLDVSCDNFSNILKQSEKFNHFRSHYKWLIFDSKQKVLTEPLHIHTVLSGISLRLDSEVLFAIRHADGSKVMIHDVYGIGNNKPQPVRVSEIGMWTARSNLKLNDQSKYNRRKNLTGVFIRTGTVMVNPIYNESFDVVFRNVAGKESDTLNKMNYALFTHLQEIHQFTYNITSSKKWFGNELGGVNDGLGQLLYENVVEIGATSAVMTSERLPFYDYVFPTYPFRTCFIFRNSRSSGTVDDEFLKPFSGVLWYTILVMVALCCVFLKFLFNVGHKSLGDFDENWHSAFLLTWGVICQQGGSFVPKPASGRCVLLSMLIMSILLYNYYTSSIVSSLLSGLPPPIKTLDELTLSRMEVGLEDLPYVKILFEVTNDTAIRNLYRKKILLQQPFLPVKDGLKKVQKGGYSYHTEAQLLYSVIEKTFEPHEICQLAEINLYVPTILWVYYQKHSEFTKMFAAGYNQMLEYGIIKRQQLVWTARKPQCLQNKHLEKIGLDHLLSAFAVIGLGVGFAFLTLFAEIYVKKVLELSVRNKLICFRSACK